MSYRAFKQVDRLVALAVLGAVGLSWFVLVGFDAFTIFVGELNDVGHGTYTLAKAASYTLLTVPRRLYEMFGYAALIGGLLGLGGLAGTGELTALRAAGMSKLRICASVVLTLVLLTAIVVVIGETVAPWGDQSAKALSLAAKSKDITLGKGGSIWAREGDTVVNAGSGRTRPAGDMAAVDLSRVRVFEFDKEGRLLTLSVAARAEHLQGKWTLFDVRRTEFGEASANSTQQAEMHWDSKMDPDLLALSIVKLDYLNLVDLARNITYLERNGQDARGFREAYWSRLFYPVNVLVLAFCALPFAFGALRSGGLSKRLFLGIVLAIGFYFLQRAVVSMGNVYGLPPGVSNALPPLLLIAMASAYFRRFA
ncbi:MAG TPA: LPS export ABC transporter permease LptG [Dokdonella sp.]|uniref:LPS export ABC transporter permease LptG n=1 Tax=Dokdonella sp. TaxID=2291710 RepID=UPI002CEFBCBC|nr:LPS export ABC transporter permease LptG [Dokdonella sp.]HOX71115.1 LPS export ABC transporter permease LptG [Dokdonella sp.]HPG93723.1 LPS export ABC transporter permease LptG [Dokdonella sp.]HPN79432.1 LPS export ABC transporter permease LptG [Dokdonella sp.]